jgi:hypothetical protein
VVQWPVGLVGGNPASQWLGGGGVGVVAHLFFQCIVVWRSLLQARGSGCQSFSSPLCFTSAKGVSSISARSLIHGAHAVCICVPVAILDPLQQAFINNFSFYSEVIGSHRHVLSRGVTCSEFHSNKNILIEVLKRDYSG